LRDKFYTIDLQVRRQKALEEMCRILRPGGRALIYAWAQEQERDSKPSTYLKQQKSESSTKNSDLAAVELNVERPDAPPLVLPVHTNRTNFEHSDLLVPWKTKISKEKVENEESKTFLRFYHVFKEGELENLILGSSVLSEKVTIQESYYDQGNWCVVLTKR
jgi:alkylated DNA repair protein alkB family protein 8